MRERFVVGLVLLVASLTVVGGCSDDSGEPAASTETTLSVAKTCQLALESRRLVANVDPGASESVRDARLKEIEAELSRSGPTAIRDFYAATKNLEDLPKSEQDKVLREASKPLIGYLDENCT